MKTIGPYCAAPDCQESAATSAIHRVSPLGGPFIGMCSKHVGVQQPRYTADDEAAFAEFDAHADCVSPHCAVEPTASH